MKSLTLFAALALACCAGFGALAPQAGAWAFMAHDLAEVKTDHYAEAKCMQSPDCDMGFAERCRQENRRVVICFAVADYETDRYEHWSCKRHVKHVFNKRRWRAEMKTLGPWRCDAPRKYPWADEKLEEEQKQREYERSQEESSEPFSADAPY